MAESTGLGRAGGSRPSLSLPWQDNLQFRYGLLLSQTRLSLDNVSWSPHFWRNRLEAKQSDLLSTNTESVRQAMLLANLLEDLLISDRTSRGGRRGVREGRERRAQAGTRPEEIERNESVQDLLTRRIAVELHRGHLESFDQRRRVLDRELIEQ
jgi:hypothetical protein